MDPARLIFAITVFAPLLCAQSTGSISGVITNAMTGAGITGVKVRAACLPAASNRCPDGAPQAVTDTGGAFRLAALSEGKYLMSVEKDGFSWAQTGSPVATVAASGNTRVDMKLTPLASLSGRVVDPEGKPVAGITVRSFGKTVITDDQGAFVFQKLNPSRYQLLAKVKAQPDRKDGDRVVDTYYPSAIDVEQAVPIQVQGLDLSGYEIRLRTAPARTVRGVLLDADGNPRPHASVELSKSGTPEVVPMIRGVYSPFRFPSSPSVDWDHYETGPDGTFEFPAVLEGDWILRGHDFVSREAGVAEARVGRSDVDNLTIRMAKLFPIEVSPEETDSQSAEPPKAHAWVVPLDGQDTAGTGTDADAPFTEHDQGLPGRYLFGPGSGTPGYYVSAAMVDGRDVLWQPVQLSSPTTVKLLLKRDGGRLQGTVEKGGGSTVVLMADPTAYARFGLTARCDKDGKFSIPDVPPGSYTAIALQDDGVLYLESREVLNRIDSAHGERVKIEAGASETVTLKVN